MEGDLQRLQVDVPKETVRQVRVLGANLGMSAANVLRQAVAEFLAKHAAAVGEAKA
ncbi:hypothetical protein [Pararobbsia alpina]|uniref:Ribbon-helix-helix protein CopG domain-containing protein n=1 Tax=Pararobbsia alpina TaxID=621374 RepID=A0A6S7B927_9BURK|nr:hypothetical protein [Pararobbsia alpina]CAB3783305.1 hypothetical protein LMG28138_01613 [Pararobbsia alpina]